MNEPQNRRQRRAQATQERRAAKSQFKIVKSRLEMFEEMCGGHDVERRVLSLLRERWPKLRDPEIAYRIGLMAKTSQQKLIDTAHEKMLEDFYDPSKVEATFAGQRIDDVTDISIQEHA